MKININFDFNSLSIEEKIEITKEVLASSDPKIKRLIENECEIPEEDHEDAKSEAQSSYKFEEKDEYIIGLAKFLNDKDLYDFVKSYEIPAPLLEKMVDERGLNFMRKVFNNANYGEYFITKYYKCNNDRIRKIIVECEDVSKSILEEMACTDTSERVQCAIAKRKEPEIIKILCETCSSIEVKKLLAVNSSTPLEYLEKWSKEVNFPVLRVLPMNEKITPEILSYIYYASNSMDIKEKCIANLKCPSNELYDYVRINTSEWKNVDSLYSRISPHPNVSGKILNIFAEYYIKQYQKTSHIYYENSYKQILEEIINHPKSLEETKKKIQETLEKNN